MRFAGLVGGVELEAIGSTRAAACLVLVYCVGGVYKLPDGFGEDLIRGIDPGERREVVVPGAGEIRDAAEAAAAHRLTGLGAVDKARAMAVNAVIDGVDKIP